MNKPSNDRTPIYLATALALAAMGARAADNLPSLGGDVEPWAVKVFYENDTRYRGKDHSGNAVGLSKFRNTLQAEADKKLGDGWSARGILRGTWDGVYRLNKSEYGRDAGGSIELQNVAGPGLPPVPTNAGTPLNLPYVPHGGGVNNAIATALGLPPTNAFGFDLNRNPNQGFEVLGQRWHSTLGGVAFGVPVRPCDTDSRGCTDFGGYGDKKLSELEAPEFNDRLDFLREAYVRKTFDLGNGTNFFLKVGKQQVVWGRTDLFRVLDVINPVDYSRNNIYDELQDIRIPMWIAQGEWRFGGSESMQERNLQLVWNFDKFRANNLGQCGTPNSILDAGCLFRGLKNIWDNGGTVSNFAANGMVATDFGPHQLGIRNVYLPSWSLSNTQLGMKFEGVTQGGLNFSVNALTYRTQLPSLRAFNHAPNLTNPFTGQVGATASHLIAFDMHFPRINLIGGSMDFQVEAAKAAVRVEAALTSGEEFPNTARNELYSRNKVFRSVIGIDRPTFIPFISTSTATLISAQLFYQHIFDHESYDGPLGRWGMVDWQDNFIGTLLLRGNLANDRIHPQLILARDFRAHAFAVSPQVDWNITNDLTITVGANLKGKNDDSDQRWKVDDCRSCNPYPPFSAYGAGHAWGQSWGLSGLEPLGRFRAGPIGAAWKENEIYVTLKYKF
jgi:hypothetical protein